MREMEKLLLESIGILKNGNFSSFSISTKISRHDLIEEEDGFDKSLLGSESVKNSINREIVSAIVKNTGLGYNPNNSDIRLIFDFSSGSVQVDYEPLFVFGRYKKLVPEISQSRWLCKKCDGDGCFKCDYAGKNYESVEEFIGEVLKRECDAKNYSLHASGREDVDATNSAGRPFVFELDSPKNRRVSLDKIIEEINSSGKIAVSDMKFVNRFAVELVANSHFDKTYDAAIEVSKNLDKGDLEKVLSLKGAVLEQRTPNRVSHRRSDMIRKRRIVDLNIISYENNSLLLEITAEPGTYIKEFVSGDKGRTKPSISEVLGTNAKCKNLKVTKIYDEFLKMLNL